jgi:hypothetical protein
MPSLEAIHDFEFTDHALIEMALRQIAKEDVTAVLANPEQTEMVREGRAAKDLFSTGLCGHRPQTALYCYCLSNE